MSTRLGGVSAPPFDTLNLRPPQLPGPSVDDPRAAAENQRRWAERLGARPVWLNQVHGRQVITLEDGTGAMSGASVATDASNGTRPADAAAALPTADAAVTAVPGLACTVLVADCLPVLMCSRSGRAVAAAHAGWRGLAGGVLEATVERLCALSQEAPGELLAWLGPCIGPAEFEVGPDVLDAFGVSTLPRADAAFRYRPRRDCQPRWLADLPTLARRRLVGAGLPMAAIHGGHWCTVREPSRFFSYRRDAVTGRMAASIALIGAPPA